MKPLNKIFRINLIITISGLVIIFLIEFFHISQLIGFMLLISALGILQVIINIIMCVVMFIKGKNSDAGAYLLSLLVALLVGVPTMLSVCSHDTDKEWLPADVRKQHAEPYGPPDSAVKVETTNYSDSLEAVIADTASTK